jgi:hypothetical protein
MSPVVELQLIGPFAYPVPKSKHEGTLPELPPLTGVYVEAIRSLDDRTYFARGIGDTKLKEGSIRTHFLAKRRDYRSGWYNLIDVDLARAKGQRRVVWQGWSIEKLDRLKKDPGLLEEHRALLERQWPVMAVFIVVGGLQSRRELQRLRAALLIHYYSQPVYLLDDRQYKAKRRVDETPILAKFTSCAALHDFPETLSF